MGWKSKMVDRHKLREDLGGMAVDRRLFVAAKFIAKHSRDRKVVGQLSIYSVVVLI